MSGLASLLLSLPPRAQALGDSSRELSTTQILQEADALASLLQRNGCRRLGLHADNGLGWVIADLACQQAGVVCVPLPLFFTWPQTLHAVHACGLDAVLTAEPARFAAHFQPGGASEVCCGLRLLRQPDIHAPPLPAGTAKVTFTSGSTGAPRGVCLSNAQQLQKALVLEEAVGIAAPVHFCALPLATLLENIAGLYAPLLAGGSVVLRSMGELGFSGSRLEAPQRFLKAIADARPDTLILIPQLLQLLVTAARNGWQAPFLKFVAVGGSRVAPELIHAARRLGLPVYEGYGLTECASVVSLNTPHADRIGSCGRPLAHMHVEAIGGEIHVAGNTMLGYVDDPKTWYPRRVTTGDLGSLDADGFLHIAGRSRNVLISSYGRNVSPEWVESELLAAPALREAVVFGDARPHCIALLTPAWPELGDAAIAAAVAAANARLPDYAQIRQWLRLPRALAATPGLLTANGRPVRNAILGRYHAEIDALYRSSASTNTAATFDAR